MIAVTKYDVSPRIGVDQFSEIYFGDSRDIRGDIIYVGKLDEIGPSRDVYFDFSSERVMAIVGKRGSGKSYTLGSILESFCVVDPSGKISKNSTPRAVLLFDTINIFWTLKLVLQESDLATPRMRQQFKLMKEWNIKPSDVKVDVWVPSGYRTSVMQAFVKDFYLNVCDFDASDWGLLLNLDLIRDRMGQLLNEVYEKVVNDGYVAGGREVPPNKIYSIQDLIRCLEADDRIQKDYHPETIRGVTQQLLYYDRLSVLKTEGTKVGDILKPGTVSVLMLSGLPDEFKMAVVSVLMKKLMAERSISSYAAKRKAIEPKDRQDAPLLEKEFEKHVPKAVVAIDEAQNILPSERKTSASDVLVRFVREGRNIGLSLVITTQQPSAIDSRIMAQVDTLIIHKLAVQKDIQTVYENLKSSEPAEIADGHRKLTFPELIRSLEVGQALVSNTETTNNIVRCFILRVRPRITAHGGFEE